MMGGSDYGLSFERGNAMMALLLDLEGKIFFATPIMPGPAGR